MAVKVWGVELSEETTTVQFFAYLEFGSTLMHLMFDIGAIFS